MANKSYGSAVLTALQAQHKSIDEIVNLAYIRRFDAYMKGDHNDTWVDCFWHNIAILVANGVRCELPIH